MHALDTLAPGTVRCVFSSALPATVNDLLAWGTTRPDGERVAVCEVDLDPSRPGGGVTEQLVRSLARGALAVWPDWYGVPELFALGDEHSLQAALDRLASRHVTAHRRSVLRPWVRRAVPLCRQNAPPVAPEFPPAVQLQQLSLAVAETDLTLVVRPGPVAEPEPGPADLLGLARNLEWVARHVSARVVAVLPTGWAGRPELDSVSWGAWTEDEAHPSGDAGVGSDEPLVVSPVRGRPHPNSPGEQLMAARLSRDPVLGPLFACNAPVVTVRGTRYLVDLVWLDGRVVVEIDGYRCHASRSEFASDRHRDYELQLSGFLVLRLTHHAVMTDVELAVDKIRDFVNLRTNCPQPPRAHA